jgi:von willebrand factor, type A
MESNELIKKVRRIEIKTRRISNNIFAGEYHTAFKGRGMSFSEVREYQYGDEVRFIDWNVTARYRRPYIKVYEEERELTVMLLVDVSKSNLFGSGEQLKRDIINEIAATLAFSTIQNNDKVGVIFFSDKIEKFIPPQKGRKHVLYIIRELIDFKPASNSTDIEVVLKYLTNVIKKRCTAFVLSDFIAPNNYNDAAVIANRKHEIIRLRVYDQRDREIPDVGLIKLKDPETEKRMWVNTSSKKVRMLYKNHWDETSLVSQQIMIKAGIESADIEVKQDYVKILLGLFRKKTTLK